MSEVIFNLLPSKNKGGMEKMFLHYSEIMQVGGYEVVALVPKQFQYFAELKDLDVVYEIFDVSGHYNIRAVIKFLCLCRRYKPGLVMAHNGKGFSVINLARRFLPKMLKDVAMCHGGSLKRVLPFNHAVVVSKYIGDDLRGKGYLNSIFHVPNFLKRKNIPDPVSLTKKELEIFRFGAISRLVKGKDFDFMLQSFAMLNLDNIELIIAGDGEERGRLEQLTIDLGIVSKVKFLGWVSDNGSFFQQIDCLIHPAFAEPFGLIILEAMSCKVPVIAARSCGPKEIITDNENGFLFEPREITSLKQKMQLVLEKSELKDATSYAGYKLMRDKYDFTNGKSNLLQVIKKINA